ncbi:hypothetical protein [Agromyces sp. NPDC049794]|uniref:hypothetical protein n=1 Tax=unclassified Agromyces TaxID=2639701 RepID=UPI003401BC3B
MGATETEEVVVDKPKQFAMEGAPGKVLWWGVVLAVLGALLVVLVPWLLDQLGVGFDAQGQDLRVGLELGLRVIRELLVPLGAALIAAAIVMGFIQARFSRRESVRHSWK